MADERTTAAPADEVAAPVPRARAAEPSPPEPSPPESTPAGDQPGPPRKRAAKAAKAAKQGEPPAQVEPAAATTPAAKKSTAKKAKKPAPTKAAANTPAAETSDRPPTKQATAAAVQVPARVTARPGVWAAAALAAVREPGQPPHRLAELAVAELGPRAADWVSWLRQTYPGASPAGIARLATQEAGRHDRAVTLLGMTGPASVPFCLPAAGWVRASVVLRIAAAHGHDPTDPRRAGELLDLLGVGDEESAGAGALRWLNAFRSAVTPLSLRRNPALAMLRLLATVSDHGDRVTRLAHRATRFYQAGA